MGGFGFGGLSHPICFLLYPIVLQQLADLDVMMVHTTFILSASITRGVTYAKLTHTVADSERPLRASGWAQAAR